MPKAVKVRVISLKSATDRRIRVESELNKLGIDFTFFDAFRGNCPTTSKPYTEEEQRSIYRFKAYFGRAWQLNSAEIGCATSHLAVLEEFINEGEQWLCVLEDDIRVKDPDTLIEILCKPEKFIPNANFAYLGAFRRTNCQSRLTSIKYRVKAVVKMACIGFKITGSQHDNLLHIYQSIAENIGHAKVNSDSDIFLSAGMHDGAHAYIINKTAAKVILQWNRNVAFSADETLNFLSFSGLLNMVLPKKEVVAQDTSLPSQLNHLIHLR